MLESGSRHHVFNLLGIPVFVDLSAVFLLIIIYQWVQQYSPMEKVVFILVALGSILLHELGHAMMSKLVRMRGIEITFVAMGGTCSYREGAVTPAKSFAISASGPLVNFALAGTAWALQRYEILTTDVGLDICRFAFGINLVLGILNSVPMFPLDGGQATLAGITWLTGRERLSRTITLYLALAIGALGIAFFYTHGPDYYMIFLLIVLLFNSIMVLGRN
jgi:Zn-dependent protease